LPAPEEPLARLLSAYAEPHRAYHDLRHVLATLERAEGVRHLLADAAAVELALWFHDAVYDPRAADNEERSARLADRLLAGLVPHRTLARIRELILATRHPSRPADPDAQLVVDIDLAILGAAPADFAAYERDVRSEYRWVPARLYRRKRGELLRCFLARDRIYLTRPFHDELEARARRNLESATRR
jgi:predicted metal-dependent HD superfamily phosphohydrolase